MKASFDIDFRTQRAEASARSVYRRARGQDPIATAASLALVGLVGSAFLYMSPVFVKKQAAVPTVVTLLALPDDPPPEQTQPQLDKPAIPPPVAIVAPPPQVVLPPQPLAPQVAQVEVAKPAPPAPQAAPAAPVARGPENLGELSARMISAKPPRYPLDSRRAHEQGTVVLSVLLSTDGRVSDVNITRSSGFVRLDRAALDAVRDWRWSPLMRDGSPVMVRGIVTIPFILQGGDGGRDRRGGGHGRGRHGGGDGAPSDDGSNFDHT